MADAVVKIDKEVEKKVEEFIRRNRFLYASKKQLVNIAIIEFLKSEELKENMKKRGKLSNGKRY
jgi:hypothetical protein